MARDLDLVIHGATGFTGKLVVEYLLNRRPPLKWGISGRSRDKLEQLGAGVPILIHDSLDTASMTQLAQRTRVVCSTVGPYALWGRPLVAACAAEGTHYCDLTGEPDWTRRMIDAHHAQAEKSGARIVPSCGFDSIPSDLGVWMLGDYFARTGSKLSRAQLRITSIRGGFSGGTLATMLSVGERLGDPHVRRAMGNPYALAPDGERSGPDRNPPFRPQRDSSTGHWLAPFLMAAPNSRVVRRSNALLGYPWGREFRYQEVMDTGGGLKGLGGALAVGAGMIGFGLAIALPPTRKLLGRFLPSPGEGPSKETRERGRFRITIDGSAEDGVTAEVNVAADLDPGYGATAIMLAESALCLATDKLPERAGLLTPATAMGQVLIDRLRAAGVRFEVA